MSRLICLLIGVVFVAGCIAIPDSDTGILVIGMENSAKYGSCPGARIDSNRMASLLSKYGKVTKLQDAQATRANVQAALAKVASKDMIIIYYSGHGGQQGRGDKSETDGKDEFLCLWDGPLTDNELWSFISTTKRTMLIVDACHSETMYRSLEMRAKAARISGSSGEFLCWSGCADSQYSYGGITGGKFTNSILRHYKSYLTYDQVWDGVVKDRAVTSVQTPMRTRVGSWSGWVFR